MFILSSEEVHYRNVSHLLTYPVKPINGLSYHDRLFVRVESYTQEQWNDAIRKCRELLEVKTSILSIIVKEPDGFTLWSEDRDVQILKDENSSVVRQQPTPTNQANTISKYRGVEISPQTEKLPAPQTPVKIKYRGVEISTQTV